MKKKILPVIFLSFVITMGVEKSHAQDVLHTQSPTPNVAGATIPGMTAHFVDFEKKAPKKEIVVEVSVVGFQLMDPALAQEKPMPAQGHLHYRVDNGFIIATPSSKLSLHEVPSGEHTVTVTLVGNDHKPVGSEVILKARIP